MDYEMYGTIEYPRKQTRFNVAIKILPNGQYIVEVRDEKTPRIITKILREIIEIE